MVEFCRHEDLRYWAFREWRQRLNKQSGAKLVKLDTRKISSDDIYSVPIEIRKLYEASKVLKEKGHADHGFLP